MRKAQAEVLPWKGPGPFLQDMSLQELWLASAPLGWLGGEHRGQESWARRPCEGQERMLWAVGGRAQQCSEDQGLTQGLATTPGLHGPHGVCGRPHMEGHAQSTGYSCHLGNILFPLPVILQPPGLLSQCSLGTVGAGGGNHSKAVIGFLLWVKGPILFLGYSWCLVRTLLGRETLWVGVQRVEGIREAPGGG